MKLANLSKDDLSNVVSTGYGRYLTGFNGRTVTEISCHAMGAKFLFPEVRTLIDIGGQDSKVTRIDESGGVENFMMNDKCAAGTGRFLEVMAQALDVELSQMGALSLLSRNDVRISSTCTVFAESEVISLLAEDCAKEDIIAGIHKAIAVRILGMAARVIVKERVAMSGGVARNIGMVHALEQGLGTKLLVAESPEIVGALGAALFALRAKRN
jgi:predicted CoA-substrate-specific enzyme activase